jgi:Thiol-disulfide isomerase and thioredoxins
VDEAALQRLIAANKGKVVLLNFWATWCEPCQEEVPKLVQLEGRLRAKGLKLIVVSADEPEQEEAARRFLVSRKVPLPSYRKQAKNDEKFINSIDTKWSGAVPAMFLYDRQGKRVKSFIGETEMPAVEAELRKLF